MQALSFESEKSTVKVQIFCYKFEHEYFQKLFQVKSPAIFSDVSDRSLSTLLPLIKTHENS